MDPRKRELVEREVQRVQANRDELVERIARAIREDGTAEPLEGIRLRRSSAATSLVPGVVRPSFCVIAQGCKEITGSSDREKAALADATEEALNPEQQGAPGDKNPSQRKYLRQAVLKRMKPFDALDARLFLAVNRLPRNRWLNGFFAFFTITFA